MGRHKNETPRAIDTDQLHEDTAARVEEVVSTVSAADALVMGATDALLAAGRIQGMIFMSTVSDVVIAQNYLTIKKSKGYIGLPYRNSEGKVETVSDLDEFCRAFFDKTYRRCQQLSENLQVLGTELYEQAELIGFRARDYQALKALPADEQAIIKQAMETPDREKVIELLQDMALKHKAEKADQAHENEGLRGDLEATQRMLDEEKTSHQESKLSLQRALRRIKTLSAEEADKELRQEAALVAYEAEVAVNGNLRAVCSTLIEHAEQSGTDYRPFLASMVRHLETQLSALRDEFMLPDAEGAEEFPWIGVDLDA